MRIFGKKNKVHTCAHDEHGDVELHDPDKLYPLASNDWTVKFDAAITGLPGLEAKLGTEVSKRARLLYVKLDAVNADTQMQLRNVYVRYSHDPCGYGEWWTRQVETILADERHLRQALTLLEGFQSGTIDGQMIDGAKVVASLLPKHGVDEPADAFIVVKEDADKWQNSQ